jgi:hypothetical protein
VVELGKPCGRHARAFTSPLRAVRDVDVVYTDVWTSMGEEAYSERNAAALRPYQVNEELMAAAAPHALFMHCLPAHRGEEVSAGVIDGPQSVVFDQAENRMHAQKALLLALMTDCADWEITYERRRCEPAPTEDEAPARDPRAHRRAPRALARRTRFAARSAGLRGHASHDLARHQGVRLMKVPLKGGAGGQFKYVEPNLGKTDVLLALAPHHRRTRRQREGSVNQIVLRTPPGSAMMVASAIDGAGWPEVLGTLGGDDTVLVIIDDPDKLTVVDAALRRHARRLLNRTDNHADRSRIFGRTRHVGAAQAIH